MICFHEFFSSGITGVYGTEIDLKQQRVSVTGNVEAQTLISKLEKKTGKRPILLLPDKAADKAASKEEKQRKPKPKENQHSNSNNGREEREAPKANGEYKKKTESREPDAAGGAGGESNSYKKGAGKGKGKGADIEEEADKANEPEEAKPSVTRSAGDQSAVPDKKAAQKFVNSERGGGGVGGKKKKAGGQDGNSADSKEGKTLREEVGGEVRSSDSGPSQDRGPNRHQSSGLDPGKRPMNQVPPYEQFDAYPYMCPHYYHGPPAYAFSCRTANPMSSYGASYYAPQPPPSSYVYTQPGPEGERALPLSEPYLLPPSDSFELFSDENPNACSVM